MIPVPPLHCSFCGKRQDEVRLLIAGPTVFICDECIELCAVIDLADRRKYRTVDAGEREYASWSMT